MMAQWKFDMLALLFPNTIRDSESLKRGTEIKYKNIPSKLYKYCNFKGRDKDNLLNRVVYMRFPKNFNDPYDCASAYYSPLNMLNYCFRENIEQLNSTLPPNINGFRFTDSEIKQIKESDNSIETANKIFAQKDATISQEDVEKQCDESIEKMLTEVNANERFKPKIDNAIVSCFSERNDLMLMWSHYTDSHKGFCLEYNFKSLPVDHETTKQIFPVIYQENLLDVTEAIKKGGNTSFGARASITKSIEWEYEREWRLIILSENERVWPVPLPQSIYIGSKIEDKNKVFLIEYARTNNIPLYKAVMSQKKFEINFEPIGDA